MMSSVRVSVVSSSLITVPFDNGTSATATLSDGLILIKDFNESTNLLLHKLCVRAYTKITSHVGKRQ